MPDRTLHVDRGDPLPPRPSRDDLGFLELKIYPHRIDTRIASTWGPGQDRPSVSVGPVPAPVATHNLTAGSRHRASRSPPTGRHSRLLRYSGKPTRSICAKTSGALEAASAPPTAATTAAAGRLSKGRSLSATVPPIMA